MRAKTGEWAHSYKSSAKLRAKPPKGPFAWYLANRAHQFAFVVFDLDAAKGDVQRDVAELADLLAEAELTYLVCASGPAGGLHVWVPTQPAEAALVEAIARAAARRLPTLDLSPLINPKTGCVRPPGAPHRHGGMSVPLAGWRPITPAAAAAVLSQPNDIEHLQRLAVLLNADAASPTSRAARGAATAVRAVELGADGPRLVGAYRDCDVSALLSQTPEPGQGHALLWTILLRLARAHWSAAQVAELLVGHLNAPGLVHLRRQGGAGGGRPLSAAERDGLLARQWDRAVAAAAALAPQDALHQEGGEAEQWRRRVAAAVELAEGVLGAMAADRGRWCTQAGPSDRKALEYLLVLTLDAVSEEIEIDCRRLALATGMGRGTAHRALGRLCLDGWLQKTADGEGQRASRYKVLPQALAALTSPPGGAAEAVTGVTEDKEETYGGGGTQVFPPPRAALPPPAPSRLAERERLRAQLRERLSIVSHDLFTHPRAEQPGLGRHMATTMAALSAETPTQDEDLYKVEELAEATGYSLQTIQGHLRTLAGHRLARRVGRTPSGAWRPTSTTLTSVADRIGASGVRERRHRAYSIERDAYAWWLAELEWMHTPVKQRRGRAAPGQAHLILLGAPAHLNQPAYPRDRNGRADHRAARAHLRARRDAAAAAMATAA